jgi:hypothetical protein
MKGIDPLVHVLSSFSDALGDSISLVGMTNIDSKSMLMLIAKVFPPAKVIFMGIGVLLGVRDLNLPFRDCHCLIRSFLGGKGC